MRLGPSQKSNTFLSKISIILGRCYHTDGSGVSDKFGFNYLFDDLRRRWNIVLDVGQWQQLCPVAPPEEVKTRCPSLCDTPAEQGALTSSISQVLISSFMFLMVVLISYLMPIKNEVKRPDWTTAQTPAAHEQEVYRTCDHTFLNLAWLTAGEQLGNSWISSSRGFPSFFTHQAEYLQTINIYWTWGQPPPPPPPPHTLLKSLPV